MSSKGAAGKAARQAIISLLELFDTTSPDFVRTQNRDPLKSEDTKRLWYMERKGYVKKFGVSYALTSTGKKILSEDRIWKSSIPKPKKWDGKWRLVMFDIPVDARKRRDAFRLRLKHLGLVCYQNSVWIYPYPLDEIVGDVCDFYYLSGCVSFIVAESLTGETKLRKHFKLRTT